MDGRLPIYSVVASRRDCSSFSASGEAEPMRAISGAMSMKEAGEVKSRSVGALGNCRNRWADRCSGSGGQ